MVEEVKGAKKGRPKNFLNMIRNTNTYRLDVMHKTLIRAVKREYGDYFHKFCKNNGIPYPVPSQKFLKTIKIFEKYILKWEDPTEIELSYGGLSNLTKTLGLFVDF